MKVCFETFGCRLNRAEALEMEASFLAAGWTKTEGHADADLIVVRGCSVTARAQHNSEKLVEHIRRKYPMKRVLVAGCLPQAAGDKKLLARAIPSNAGIPVSTARAYLKVQDGCNSDCTFCIVPKFRGRAASVPFEECIDKAKAFIDAGYRELVVTGCNVAQYNSQGKTLPGLVAALATLDPSVRVRLSSIEPGRIAEEVVDAMAANPNICRFLHLSIQSGSSRILSAMHRKYTERDVDGFLSRVEKKLPSCGLGADFITGFPGETDLDFMATAGFVKRHRFNLLHVFPYSERPGTPAASLPGEVPRAIRKARAHELSKEGVEKRRDFAKSFMGKTVEIIVEDEKKIEGWTSEYMWCEARNVLRKTVRRKDRVRIAIRKADGDILSGIVL